MTNTEYVPRILVIGAGSRGSSYAKDISDIGLGTVAAVAEPNAYKRRLFGSKYIWKGETSSSPGQEYESWQDFVAQETARRTSPSGDHGPRINAIFVCVLDEEHVKVLTALAPFGFHVMSEKPLATTLEDCLSIYASMRPPPGQAASTIFGICHVLRYSPHNMLLRDLVLQQNVVGDVLSIEHTEPVGWWHFTHSYVRGNWRRESSTAPSLLTKSCHDIDWLLWMMCSPPRNSDRAHHLPAFLSSTGALNHFRKARKPKAAGSATNCLSCPINDTCIYSAPRIYVEKQLAKGIVKWPIKIIKPEIETCYQDEGPAAAHELLMTSLAEDYSDSQTLEQRLGRSWYGRCVFEADNDVCDDQFVTITWDDQPDGIDSSRMLNAKTATFHMIAGTEKICERRGRIYGDKGEIEYDGTTINVYDFATESTKTFRPPSEGSGHGGGDRGLVTQFLRAVIAADTQAMTAEEAQVEYLGCTLEEVVRSHAMVFAAEEARRERRVVDWSPWWSAQVKAASVGPTD